MRPALRAAVLLALAGHLCAPPAARAQRGGTEPLRKVELVRLLGSRAISTAQVVTLVRRNCVAFRPSERDRADLGAAGSALAIVLEVRDPTGAPIAKQPAAFAVSAGAVTPAAAEADAAGTVRVRVTLPEHAGPVVITAKVGTFSRTATVYADPGPAHELVVERGRAAVVGSVAVRTRDTLVLRVVARDAYGNRTTLADFTATTSGRAIGLVAAAAADSQALVTLEPRK